MPEEADMDQQKVYAAAYLAATGAFTQDEIAKRLGTKQSTIAKWLGEARRLGVLRTSFEFPASVDKHVKHAVEQLVFQDHARLEAALIDRSRKLAQARGSVPVFKRLHVIPTSSLGSRTLTQADATAAFGHGAAQVVSGYINRVEQCFVGWGRTLSATIDAIPVFDGEFRAKEFIPITGTPIRHEPRGVSPSDGAEALALRWPGSRALSLRGVPARIPKRIAEKDPAGILMEFVEFSDTYCKIFGPINDGTLPKADTSQMIVTGLGDLGTSHDDPWFAETKDAEGADALKSTVGNVGGLWLPTAEASPQQISEIEQLNSRWLGLGTKAFMRCATYGDPGVVVLALEETKAEIVLQSIALVNVLIVSFPLAKKLVDRIFGDTDG
jgi:hypothetical protein